MANDSPLLTRHAGRCRTNSPGLSQQCSRVETATGTNRIAAQRNRETTQLHCDFWMGNWWFGRKRQVVSISCIFLGYILEPSLIRFIPEVIEDLNNCLASDAGLLCGEFRLGGGLPANFQPSRQTDIAMRRKKPRLNVAEFAQVEFLGSRPNDPQSETWLALRTFATQTSRRIVGTNPSKTMFTSAVPSRCWMSAMYECLQKAFMLTTIFCRLRPLIFQAVVDLASRIH